MKKDGSALISDMLRESIANGVVPRLTITSNSMAPLLATGDEIGLIAADLNQLTPYSIITFDVEGQKGTPLTHRVANSFTTNEGPIIITWADRSLLFDKPFLAPQIIGKVIWRKRGKNTISLEIGWGKWLNQRLCLLAQQEMKKFIGCYPYEISLSNPIAEMNDLRSKNLSNVRWRFLKRAGRIQAEILSTYASIMNQLSGHSQGEYAH